MSVTVISPHFDTFKIFGSIILSFLMITLFDFPAGVGLLPVEVCDGKGRHKKNTPIRWYRGGSVLVSIW
jgi:hypothetical protein